MSALGKLATLVVLGPIAILVAGIGGCEARKAYYDWQVRKMCENDGGIAVYEHIQITPEVASRMRRVDGHLSIGHESIAPSGDIAFLRGGPSVLREGALSLSRHEYAVVRRADEKVMARVVRYRRSGGDFPFTASHPSSFSCPDSPHYYAEIAKVFTVRGQSK